MVTCANCNYSFDDVENTGQACPKCHSKNRIIQLSGLILSSSITPDNVELIVTSSPPFSFGAIVTVERNIPDGQIIKLVDPIYTELIDAIENDPQLMYQIHHRKWEEIIAAAYDKAGFDEVILTPRSADYGRDVIVNIQNKQKCARIRGEKNNG